MDRFVGTGSENGKRHQWKLRSVVSSSARAYPSTSVNTSLTRAVLKKKLHYSETTGCDTFIHSKPTESTTSLSINASRDIPLTVAEIECSNTLNNIKTNENDRRPSYVTFENNAKFQIPIVAQIHNTNGNCLVNNDDERVIESNEEDVFLTPTSNCEV